MKKTKNLLAIVAMMLLVAMLSVAGTVAWLTAETSKVTNEFTVGDINITLTETTEEYKIIPGATIAKDPKVTVQSGSEKCYVYVAVANNLLLNDGTAVATLNIDTTKWVKVEGSAVANTTIYRYYEVVDASTAAKELPVFTEVTIAEEEVTKANIQQLADKTVVIDAFAHQSENIDAVADADAAAVAHFNSANNQ